MSSLEVAPGNQRKRESKQTSSRCQDLNSRNAIERSLFSVRLLWMYKVGIVGSQYTIFLGSARTTLDSFVGYLGYRGVKLKLAPLVQLRPFQAALSL